MPAVLTLKLLGTPQITLDGSPVVGFISAKTEALLIYLAVNSHPHTRNALAGLLWGEMPQAQAAKNLRNALSNLRALVGPYLLITHDEVSFNRDSPYYLDIESFQSALGGDLAKKDLATLHSGVELYQGDFVEGFYVGDALAMEEWLAARRSILNSLMVQALQTLVVKHLEREEYAAGIDYANRLLAIEPWREETHRHLMLLLTRSRQRSAALAQYDTCRQVLAAELGVEPMPETTALYERIKAVGVAPPHNLPPQLTPIIGRDAELAEIASFMNNPFAQLLTLIGSGGIGKTRLALQAAARCAEPETNVEQRFSDGIFFVPLTGDAPGQGDAVSPSLLNTLGDAFKLDLKGPVHPQAQLLNYLRDKDMLLLLDNFDHLVSEARQLADLVRLAPCVKLLVTSRVRLNLQEEWLLEVKGLDFPMTDAVDAESALGYSAVKLFIQQARRVRPRFTLGEAEAHDVVRICQLVEGVPLGIELAASWLRVLSCAEIVSEIEKSVDFLTSTLQDVPVRHRSVRAVFDYSWNLLAPAEQAAFRRLSVFRGGFQREAAAKVVGVSLSLLAGLVDKSLFRRNAAGRYEPHDLLRQFAEEKLQADPQEYVEIHNRHCQYFAQLLMEHQPQLQDESTPQLLTALDAERENVRAAWNWAVSMRRVEELNLFMECL